MPHYIGIDLGGTSEKIGVVDEQGNIVYKGTFAIDNTKKADTIVNHIGISTLKVIKKSGINKEKIKGVGIGAPGVLDPENGRLHYVVNIKKLNNYDIGPVIREIIGLPTYIENDANAMALGELLYGAAKGYKHVIALTLGTGVGGGIIINGQLYRGANYSAGEIGHMSIDCNGLLCNCGNYGCIERYVGREGIVNRFKAYLEKNIETNINDFLENGEITPRAIAEAARTSDKLSLEVLQETGRYLGVALASLVNIFNPEIIVIGGGIASAGELLLESAKREMQKRAYAISYRAVKVVPAKFQNDAGIIGSAAIAASRINA